tara:strand:- start:1328 stop:1987 length:660 start_codon:yes stop_codon:yes gene_type:complete
MKSLVLIPCYNTHKYLSNLISLIISQTENAILIFDDGSSPALNIDKFSNNNINLIRNNTNKGKGYCIIFGFRYALENGYTHVITMDGDMQHDPMEINKFINYKDGNDFLLGYRRFSRPMPISRIISNSITSQIISILKGKKIYDSQCGYRRYKLESIKNFTFKENGYLFESEILLTCISKNTNIDNLKIKAIYDGSPSHINKITDSIKFINLITRYIFA